MNDRPRDILKLPAQLTMNDLVIFQEVGTGFRDIREICKQAIIDACGRHRTVEKAFDQIIETVETQSGKILGLITAEEWSDLNSVNLDHTHRIVIIAKGVAFCFII